MAKLDKIQIGASESYLFLSKFIPSYYGPDLWFLIIPIIIIITTIKSVPNKKMVAETLGRELKKELL